MKKYLPTISILILTAIVMAGGYIYYYFEENSLRTNKYQEIKAIGQLKANQIMQWYRERNGDAQSLSKSNFFAENLSKYLTNNDINLRNKIKARLINYKNIYSYREIMVFTSKGKCLISTGPIISEIDSVLNTKIGEAVKSRQIVTTDLYRCRIDKGVHLDFLSPIMNNNKVFAIIVLRIDPKEYFFPLIQTFPIPSKTAETLLIRKEGHNVLFLNELRHMKNTELNLSLPLDSPLLPAARLISGYEGVFEGIDYRNKAVLSYLIKIPSTPWFMVAKIDKSEIFNEIYNRGFYIGIMTLILAFAVGIMVVLFYSSKQKKVYQQLFYKEREIRNTQEVYKTTLYSIGDGVITTDSSGRIKNMNHVAEFLTGWNENEASGKLLSVVFKIINEKTRAVVDNPVRKVLHSGSVVGLANHTLLISKDGREIPIADSGAPIKDENKNIIGVVLVFRDQSSERFQQIILNTRLELFGYAASHSLKELMVRIIDILEELTQSKIGFFHFVENNLSFLTPQAWSTRTQAEFCKAEGKHIQDSLENSGLWADCVKQKKSLIHNNFPSLENKRGLPENHAGLIRLLVVPIFKNEKVIAVIGVGNKSVEYNQSDLKIVQYLSQICWEIIENKRLDEINLENQKRFADLYYNLLEGVCFHELLFDNDNKPYEYKIMDINPAYETILGISHKAAVGHKSCDVYKTSEPPLFDIYKQVVLTGQAAHFETYFAPLQKHFSITAIKYKDNSFITIFEDITERTNTRNELLLRNEILSIFLSNSDNNLYRNILICILREMDSSFGLLGYSDENGDLIVPCTINYEPIETNYNQEIKIFPKNFLQDTNLASVYRSGETILDNSSEFIPPGTKYTLSRYIMIPIFFGNSASGLILIGNKNSDYDKNDLEHLKKISSSIGTELYLRIQLEKEETIRKETEKRIIHLNRLYSMLSHSNSAIVKYSDKNELLSEICRIAIDHGKFVFAWIGFYDTITGRINPTAKYGNDDGFLDNFLTNLPTEEDSNLPCLLAYHQNRIVVINNIMTDVSASGIKNESLKRGYKSIASAPIHLGEIIIGVFTLYSGEPDFFQEKEIGLLSEIGMDMSFAMLNFEKEDLRKEAETRLIESERNYSDLYENSPDMLVSIEPRTGTIILCNQTLSDVTGYSKNDLIGKPVTALLHPKDLDKLQEIQQLFEETGKIFNIEANLITKNGIVINILINATAVYDGDGNILHSRSVWRNITELKAIQEQILNEKRWSEQIINMAPSIIIVLNQKTKIISFNKYAEKLTGYKKEEVIGKNWIEFFVPDDNKPEIYLLWDKIIKYNLTTNYVENFILTKDKTPKIIRWKNAVIRDRGKEKLVLSMGEDITEKKIIEDELHRRDEQFRKLSSQVPGMIFQIKKNTDNTLCIPYSSEGIQDIFDCTPLQVIEDFSPIRKAIYLDDYTSYLDSLESSAKDLSTWKIEFRVQLPGHPVRWLYCQGMPEKQKDGSIIWYGFNTDITDRKLSEDALRESEEKFRFLFETSYEGICVSDENEDIFLVNKRLSQMLGYTQEELRKMNFRELLSPDDLEEHLLKKQERMSGQPDNYERKLLNKNGEYIWTLVSAAPYFDKNNQYAGSFGMFTDITNIKLSDKALKESEERFRSISQTARDAIVVANALGRITYWNSGAKRIFGYSSNEIIGNDLAIILPQEYRELHLNGLNNFMESKPPTLMGRTTEMHGLRKNGEKFPLELSISYWQTEEGINYSAIIRDITDRKKMTDELINAKERAEESNNLKSEFLAQMSHEIRTPIHVIISSLSFIRDDLSQMLQAEDHDLFDNIELSAKRIIRTIDLILNVSEMQLGIYELHLTQIDINKEIISKLLLEYKILANKKGVELEYKVSADYTEIEADEYCVTQIFANLIDNGIKYTNKGKVTVRLINEGQDKIIVEISDTGIGMSEEFQNKLFEPFLQEDRGYSRKYEGNGLGLSLVKRYCDMNNAVIEVLSKKNKGSTFRVIFTRHGDQNDTGTQ